MQTTDSFENLMLGKIEGGRRWGQQRMRWLPFPSPGIFPTKGLNHKDLLNGLKKMSK